MSIAFPIAPSNGDTHDAGNGTTYVYVALTDSWKLVKPNTDVSFVPAATVSESIRNNGIVRSSDGDVLYNTTGVAISSLDVSTAGLLAANLVPLSAAFIDSQLENMQIASAAEVLAVNANSSMVQDITDPANAASWDWRKISKSDMNWLKNTIVPTADIQPSTVKMKQSLPVSEILVATGLTAPVFTLKFGTLPTGIAFNSGSGLLSGTPTVASEAYDFIIRATGSDGNFFDVRYSGDVIPGGWQGNTKVLEIVDIGNNGANTGWTGITYDYATGNFITQNFSTNLINVHAGKTATITSSFSAPTAGNGLDIYNGDLYTTKNGGTDKIYRLNGISSTVLSTFTPGSSSIQGIAFANGDTFINDGGNNTLRQNTGVVGANITSWAHPATASGLCWDGYNLISTSISGANDVIRWVGTTSVLLDTQTLYTTPTYGIQDVAYDGEFLWLMDYNGRILKMGD